MLVPGQTLRNIELAELLGTASGEILVLQVLQGGMGAVAKIQDTRGRLFALKFLELKGVESAALERFRREVQIWVTAASCDAVVDVLGTLRINEIPAVCAEWMPGGDLIRLMQSSDPRIFYSTLDRIIAALDWVHREYQIIHRDIKPSNILLDQNGAPYISDWGIGKVEFRTEDIPRKGAAHPKENQAPPSAILTRTGQTLGTIPYCSPEQILNSSAVDFRSDQYSLGCLMYQWETGTPPYMGTRWEEIARQQLESPAPKIGGFFRKSRFGAESVIERCLMKRAEDRFASYGELRNAVRRCATRVKINIPESEVSRRRVLPLVGNDQFSQVTLKAIGDKGYGLIEQDEWKGFIREAEVLSSVGEWQKAYDIYARCWLPSFYPDDIAGINPNIGVAINLAWCLVNLGRAEEAIEVLGTIPESQKTDAAYFVILGNALNHLGKYSEAERINSRGLKVFPDDSDLLGNMTVCLTFQGKHFPALSVARKRLALDRNVHSLEEAGVVHQSIGADLVRSDFPKALEHLTTAARLFAEARKDNPVYSPAQVNLARTLFEIGLYDDAMHTASTFPMEPYCGRERGILIAECLNRTGAAKECLEFCQKWRESFHNEARFLRVEAETIADFYFIGMNTKDGRRVVVAECVEFFSGIIADVGKRRPSDFGYLARIEEWLGRPEKAMSIAKEAQSFYGNKGEVLYDHALLYGLSREWKTSYEHSQRACKSQPWHPPAWRQRAWIEQNLGMSLAAKRSKDRGEELTKRIERLQTAAGDSLRSAGIIHDFLG